MKLNTSERFSDLTFSSIGISGAGSDRDVILRVDDDPADGANALRLRNVWAFSVNRFGLQNVVGHLAYCHLKPSDLAAFTTYAQSEGAGDGFYVAQTPDQPMIGANFVPANGADIFVLCASIEKVGADGNVLFEMNGALLAS